MNDCIFDFRNERGKLLNILHSGRVDKRWGVSIRMINNRGIQERKFTFYARKRYMSVGFELRFI